MIPHRAYGMSAEEHYLNAIEALESGDEILHSKRQRLQLKSTRNMWMHGKFTQMLRL